MFNVFFLVGFAVVLGMALAIFITRQKVPHGVPMVPPEDDYETDREIREIPTPEQLLELGEALCKENGLTVKDRLNNKPSEIYLVAESKNDFFFGTYVLCFYLVPPENPFVGMTDVLEFKDFIKSLGSTKGFFFTNGYFTRDVHQPLEGPKVALYNRRKVREERVRMQLAKA